MFYIFVKTCHVKAVSEVQYDSASVGIMGSIGNKGGMAIRFHIYDTTICAINSHLNSRTEDVSRRNQDYHDISTHLSFLPETGANAQPISIFDHDVLIWMGDLNYRINAKDAYIRRLISQRSFTELLCHDQLKVEMRSGRCFEGFVEAPITFGPTFRFEKDSSIYTLPKPFMPSLAKTSVQSGNDTNDVINDDTTEKQPCKVSPAWCDRVLWRTKGENGSGMVAPLQYSRRELQGSAHKPVALVMLVNAKTVVQEARSQVLKEVMKQLVEEENAARPEVTLSKNTLDFQKVEYLVAQTKTIAVKNTGRVQALWRFIPKHRETALHKPWLSVSPSDGLLMPGESVEVRVTVLVNNASAHKLNAREDTIDDVIVLHLDKGQDYFVNVSGNYLRTCFGMSLNLLSRYPHPVRNTLPISEANAEDRLALPKEIWRIVDYLYLCGMDTPGIFAQSGSSDMAQIRECLDIGASFMLYNFGVHSMAETLIRFLESLSEPVIPFALYQQCIDASSSYQAARRIVCTQLTAVHYNTFYYLISFMQELLTHKDKNGLTQERLVNLFSSILLRSPDPKAKQTEEIIRKKIMFFNYFVSSNNTKAPPK